VFKVTSVDRRFCATVGAFLTNTMPASEIARVVRDLCGRLQTKAINIVCSVGDAHATNLGEFDILGSDTDMFPMSDYVHVFKLGRNPLLGFRPLQRVGHVPISLDFILENRHLFPHLPDSVLFTKDRMKVFPAQRLVGADTVSILRQQVDLRAIDLAEYLEAFIKVLFFISRFFLLSFCYLFVIFFCFFVDF